ncbi:hypothetical protein J3R83DRAFT_13768 [Lanmaoa asiatica]|nr:hypothetical protein J3R83DRAFT_13768 [Lanmaoa asiatica]
MSNRGRGFDRGRGGGRGGGGGGGRGSPDPRGRGGPPPSFRGGNHGGRGFRARGAPRARGGVFMLGRPAAIDRRIADDSDKALVATFPASRPSADSDSMPLRPDFGTDGRQIKLRTNFFPVRVPKGPLYEYDVAITPVAGTAVRRVKRRIYQLAEQTTAWKQAGMTGKVAHDSSAKLIAAFLLPQPLTIKVPYYDEEESGPAQQGGKEYTLTIKFIQEIDTSNLVSHLAGQAQFRNYDVLPVIAALNIILASTPGRTGVMVGRNRYFFRAAAAPSRLGGGLEAWKGFYSSIRPAHKQLMVNVNVCTTAFYVPGNLARAMVEFRDSSFGARMEVFCKSVRIKTTHLGYRKTVKKLARHNAKTYTFDTPEYGRVSVEEYFKRKYNIRLQHPDLQLVDVGGQKTNYLPAEVCEILPDQPFRGKLTDEHTAEMITVACQPPNVNGEAIVNQGLTYLGLKVAGPELQSFGVSVGPDMAVVPGRILPKPGIRYQSSQASIDDRASWNLRGVKFAVGTRLEKWTVLVIKDGGRDEFAGSTDPDLHQVVSGFRSMCNTSGMQVTSDPTYTTAQLPRKDRSDPMRRAAIDTIRNTLLTVKPKPTLLFVMLSNTDKAIYDGLKHPLRRLPGLNMKMGGVNHKLDPNSARWLSSAPTMIVGMDVTHPSPGSAVGTPSIAAVVASVDNNFAQYPVSLEIQQSKKEMITNLKVEKLPDRILVYRDGVSEGQFNIVRLEERPLIFEAFQAFSTPKGKYRPKLTIIICGKRHHTRFYPTEEDSAAGDGNPRPGTVVDRGVTADL